MIRTCRGCGCADLRACVTEEESDVALLRRNKE
jgi:hypothetical protein